MILTSESLKSQWVSTNYNLWGKLVLAQLICGDTIFAGTNRNGLYYSTNNGNNWITISAINPYVRYMYYIDNKIYVTGDDGIFYTTNRGANWTNLGMGNYYCPICFSGTTIYVGTYGSGVYFSTNNGVNWTQTTLNNKYVQSLVAKDNAVYAGVQGGIYKTTDNGLTWSSAVTSLSVYGIKVAGNNIVASSSQGIFVSSDNGSNWVQITTQSNLSYILTLCGSDLYCGYGTSPYTLIKSTNNGLNWQSIYTSTYYIYSISALNSNTINVGISGTNGYMSTTDGGATWLVPQTTNINSIIQAGSVLYSGSNSGVFSSTDGGQKWYIRNFTSTVYSLLYRSNYLFAGTNGSGIYYTTNDGVNWTQTTLNNKQVWSLTTKDTNIIAGTNTGVLYSSDNGANWIQSSMSTFTVRSVYTVDSLVFAGCLSAGVMKSTDKGANWSPTSLIYIDAYSLYYNSGKLYAGTPQGIYISTNLGTNWTLTSYPAIINLSFASYGSSIFAGSNGNGVYVTRNAGINWTQSNDGMGLLGPGALCTYGNYLIAGTNNGFYRRYILEFAPIRGDATLDSLVNVLDVTATVNYILGNNPLPFSFLAADVNTDNSINVLDIVGIVNIILHPTDKFFANNKQTDKSGTAFLSLLNNQLSLTNTVNVSAMQFRLSGTGLNGVTFTPSPQLSNYQIAVSTNSDTSKTYVIFNMSDTSIGTGVHNLGTFTGLNNGVTMNNVVIADEQGNGIVTGMPGSEGNEVPKEYFLGQNYPNPFNPVTVIKFAVPKSGITSLKIYDVTGRLVKTLVDGYVEAGFHEREFNASSLSSGIYFYKLNSGSYSAVKKMAVIK
ncbi:MAG: T9SS type A sorting domain-containing protein [Bacteroidetes bacterium]|nr:T9SS type A sorting domain-containing protein [Bacteroidota bacterium]